MRAGVRAGRLSRCSRNARPQKGLVRRTQLRVCQPALLELSDTGKGCKIRGVAWLVPCAHGTPTMKGNTNGTSSELCTRMTQALGWKVQSSELAPVSFRALSPLKEVVLCGSA